MTKERQILLDRLAKLGVSDIHGVDPYTMPIDKLTVLCNWLEKRYKTK